MSAVLYLLTLCLPLATVLLVFAMRSVSAVQQAKARLAHEGSFRQIAEKAATAEGETAAALVAIQGLLGDLRARLTAVEKVLKEVE